MPQNEMYEGHGSADGLAALDFSFPSTIYADAAADDSTALDALASQPDPEVEDYEAADSFVLSTFDSPVWERNSGELDAGYSQSDENISPTEDDISDEEPIAPISVTNPPETVTVWAIMDGSTTSVRLSPKVTSMTEAELADEILVVADIARRSALAYQRSSYLEIAARSVEGIGRDGIAGFDQFLANGTGMKLPTKAEAEAAQAEAFATRYAAER